MHQHPPLLQNIPSQLLAMEAELMRAFNRSQLYTPDNFLGRRNTLWKRIKKDGAVGCLGCVTWSRWVGWLVGQPS